MGLAIACVVVTAVAGWWGVPVAAFAWGAWAGARFDRPTMLSTIALAALAASLAWGAILAWTATSAPVGALADTLGRLANAPAAAMVSVTLVFGAALGASGAAAGAVVGARRAGETRRGR